MCVCDRESVCVYVCVHGNGRYIIKKFTKKNPNYDKQRTLSLPTYFKWSNRIIFFFFSSIRLGLFGFYKLCMHAQWTYTVILTTGVKNPNAFVNIHRSDSILMIVFIHFVFRMYFFTSEYSSISFFFFFFQIIMLQWTD